MGHLHIGTSGWSYPDWNGVVYPVVRPRGFSELAYLAEILDAVEINTSFYRPLVPRIVEGWLRRTESNPRFLFTAKLWQRFTHDAGTDWTREEVEQAKAGFRPLAEAGRLGAVLAQFPWSFAAERPSAERLARIAEAFGEYPLAVEVRHASWLEDENLERIRRAAMAFCNIDQPRSSQSISRTNLATAPFAYYRFHGRNREAWFRKDAGRDERYNYLYRPDELEPWARDIEAMLSEVNRVFVMTNNHYRGQAAVNALQLKARLGGGSVPVPEPLAAAYPVLKAVSAPRPRQRHLDF